MYRKKAAEGTKASSSSKPSASPPSATPAAKPTRKRKLTEAEADIPADAPVVQEEKPKKKARSTKKAETTDDKPQITKAHLKIVKAETKEEKEIDVDFSSSIFDALKLCERTHAIALLKDGFTTSVAYKTQKFVGGPALRSATIEGIRGVKRVKGDIVFTVTNAEANGEAVQKKPAAVARPRSGSTKEKAAPKAALKAASKKRTRDDVEKEAEVIEFEKPEPKAKRARVGSTKESAAVSPGLLSSLLGKSTEKDEMEIDTVDYQESDDKHRRGPAVDSSAPKFIILDSSDSSVEEDEKAALKPVLKETVLNDIDEVEEPASPYKGRTPKARTPRVVHKEVAREPEPAHTPVQKSNLPGYVTPPKTVKETEEHKIPAKTPVSRTPGVIRAALNLVTPSARATPLHDSPATVEITSPSSPFPAKPRHAGVLQYRPAFTLNLPEPEKTRRSIFDIPFWMWSNMRWIVAMLLLASVFTYGLMIYSDVVEHHGELAKHFPFSLVLETKERAIEKLADQMLESAISLLRRQRGLSLCEVGVSPSLTRSDLEAKLKGEFSNLNENFHEVFDRALPKLGENLLEVERTGESYVAVDSIRPFWCTVRNFPWDYPLETAVAAGIVAFTLCMISIVNWWKGKKNAEEQLDFDADKAIKVLIESKRTGIPKDDENDSDVMPVSHLMMKVYGTPTEASSPKFNLLYSAIKKKMGENVRQVQAFNSGMVVQGIDYIGPLS